MRLKTKANRKTKERKKKIKDMLHGSFEQCNHVISTQFF
jgi:hypothetical protein